MQTVCRCSWLAWLVIGNPHIESIYHHHKVCKFGRVMQQRQQQQQQEEEKWNKTIGRVVVIMSASSTSLVGSHDSSARRKRAMMKVVLDYRTIFILIQEFSVVVFLIGLLIYRFRWRWTERRLRKRSQTVNRSRGGKRKVGSTT